MFNNHLTANLLRNSSEKNVNRLRFDRIMVMSLWPRFFAHPVHRESNWNSQLWNTTANSPAALEDDADNEKKQKENARSSNDADQNQCRATAFNNWRWSNQWSGDARYICMYHNQRSIYRTFMACNYRHCVRLFDQRVHSSQPAIPINCKQSWTLYSVHHIHIHWVTDHARASSVLQLLTDIHWKFNKICSETRKYMCKNKRTTISTRRY